MEHLLRLSMFDGPFILWVNWTLVDTIHPLSNKFVMGVKIKTAGESKLNDNPGVKMGTSECNGVTV